MIRNRREVFLLSALTAFLGLTALWAWGRCAGARDQCASVERDLAACRRLARRIEQLHHRPNLAGAETLQLSVLSGRIEEIARRTGIGPDSIEHILPLYPRRAGETVYMENPTRLVLQNVSMQQLVTLLYALRQQTPGLWTRSLRLQPPPAREGDRTWNAEVEVSYLIYSPPAHASGAIDGTGG